MSPNRTASRGQFKEIIRRAQESLDSAQLLGEKERTTPLIFEVMYQEEGEVPYMCPFIHEELILPSSDDHETIDLVFDLLEYNSDKFEIGDEGEVFEQNKKKGYDEKKEYIERLCEEYKSWKIPYNFSASGILYYTWWAYGNKLTSGVDDSLQNTIDRVLLMNVSPGETTRSLTERMIEYLNFDFLEYTESGNKAKINVSGYEEEIIISPYSKDSQFYNWVEYSVIHQIEYGDMSEDRSFLLSHYPLIVDDCWYLGFAYALVPRNRQEKTPSEEIDQGLKKKREKHRLMRKTAFEFTAMNLGSALIKNEVGGIKERRFRVRDWESEREDIKDELSSRILACFPEKSRPPWLKKDCKISIISKPLKDALDDRYKQVWTIIGDFHDRYFEMLNHDLKPSELSLNTLEDVPDKPELHKPKRRIESKAKEVSAMQFKMKMLSGAILERSYLRESESNRTFRWEDAVQYFKILYGRACKIYDFDVPHDESVSNVLLHTINIVLENSNEYDYEIEECKGIISHSDKNLILKHQKLVTVSDARDIIDLLEHFRKDKANSISVDLEHGTEIIAHTVEQLEGEAYWGFTGPTDADTVEVVSPTGFWTLEYPAPLDGSQINEHSNLQWFLDISLPLIPK